MVKPFYNHCCLTLGSYLPCFYIAALAIIVGFIHLRSGHRNVCFFAIVKMGQLFETSENKKLFYWRKHQFAISCGKRTSISAGREEREKIVREKSINKVNYDLLIKIHPIDSIGKEDTFFFLFVISSLNRFTWIQQRIKRRSMI